MFWNMLKRLIIVCFIIIGVSSLIYFIFIRTWILRMGATDEEVKMTLPGDDLVISPTLQYMQAITIDAPKNVVWGYLIQVGYKRAGWYNWDFINRMASKDYFYENNKSAERIIPELQNLKEGDKIFLVPGGGMDVLELKDMEYFILTSEENNNYITSWLFAVKEIDKNSTRLYTRYSSKLGEGFIFSLINRCLIEPGGVGIQQWQMLKGIKERTEKDYKSGQ